MNIEQVKLLMEASGQMKDESVAELYFGLMYEEWNEFCEAFTDYDEVAQFDACLDLIWVTIGFMLAKGWPIKEGWDEVARSNLDKICPETLSVIRRDDGKILKPEGWTPPDLASLIYKAKTV